MPDFACIVAPFNDLFRKGTKWTWSQDHHQAFEEVKARLVLDLACPDFGKMFILQTDARDYGIGAILIQKNTDIEDGEKVISYSSRTLYGAENNYSTTDTIRK